MKFSAQKDRLMVHTPERFLSPIHRAPCSEGLCRAWARRDFRRSFRTRALSRLSTNRLWASAFDFGVKPAALPGYPARPL